MLDSQSDATCIAMTWYPCQGHYTEGAELIDSVLDVVRKEAWHIPGSMPFPTKKHTLLDGLGKLRFRSFRFHFLIRYAGRLSAAPR